MPKSQRFANFSRSAARAASKAWKPGANGRCACSTGSALRMAYRVERSEQSARDLEAIFDFLFDAATGFGDDPQEAFEDAMQALGKAPHQGALRPDLLPGIRNFTKDRAIFYFDVNDAEKSIRVLAVFFGGQDHQRAMLVRAMKMPRTQEGARDE